MSENLKDLLARIEGAAEADRRLDYEIFSTFAVPGEANPWDPKEGHFYTSSVDAALSLASRLLPKWSLGLGMSEGYRWPVVTMGRSYPTNKTVSVEHRTAPLNICAAVLHALIAEEDPASHPHTVTRQGEKPTDGARDG